MPSYKGAGMKPPEKWLPGLRAAQELGVSKTSLKRWADQGILSEGKHFARGPHPTSPTRWEVVGIAAAIAKQQARPPRPAAAATEEGQTDG
jgi:hypothetical protein